MILHAGGGNLSWTARTPGQKALNTAELPSVCTSSNFSSHFVKGRKELRICVGFFDAISVYPVSNTMHGDDHII